MTLHDPTRPGWTCEGCSAPWPCHTRQHQLAAEFDGKLAQLAAYMGQCLAQACADRPFDRAGDLHTRFLGWIRAPHHSHRAAP